MAFGPQSRTSTGSSPDLSRSAGFPSLWRSPAILPAIILVLTGCLIAAESVVALAIVLLEGGTALAVLAAAGLAGMWLVPLVGLGGEAFRERLMVGAGLGIGALSLLVLGLGEAGRLNAGAVWLVAILSVAALLRVAWEIHLVRRKDSPGDQAAGGMGSKKAAHDLPSKPVGKTGGERDVKRAEPTDSGAAERARREALALSGFHSLWLLVIPFLAIALLAATLPPGILWKEEAWGYDILEYHLAIPKEFYEAGHVFFMPYNVYGSFPLNGEMLFLLLMHLRGDPIEAAFMAQLLNVGLGILFVAAAWWTGRLYSRKAGVAAGVLAATTPWMVYLAGIAYVEPGMLAMGMLALGAMLRGSQTDVRGKRWMLAAGLLAGLSCGYKYTAVVFIAAPLVIIPLLAERPWSDRLGRAGVFVLAALLAFSPWMIRNVIDTGNPVFPLAYSVFGAKPGLWDAELQARWQSGHSLAGAGLGPGASLLVAAADLTVLDTRLGLMLILLAVAGVVLRRDRWTLALFLILAAQIVVWLTATHLFARFAVVALLPLLLLAGRVAEHLRSRVGTAVLATALVVGVFWNLYHLVGLYYIHTRSIPVQVYGHLNWFAGGEWPGYDYLKIVNDPDLDEHPRVMLVGEARTFYIRPPRDYAVVFSRHPLATAVARLAGPAGSSRPESAPGRRERADPAGYRAVVDWLADRGVTHVLVNWLEMDRLRNTYGFDDRLTPALFTELEGAGLERMGDFMLPEDGPVYATLYEVPHE